MEEYNCKAKVFITRFKKAKAVRDEWASLLREAYQLFLPNRNAFSDKSGRDNMVKVFDDTGTQSVVEFVNSLKNKLLPSQQNWAKLTPSGKIKTEIINGKFSSEENDQLQLALDKQTEIMFEYIHASNFDNAVIESLSDMTISTGALMIQETNDLDNPMNFVSIPMDELVVEEASDGTIKNVYREWQIKAEEIDSQWSDRNPDDKLDRLIREKPTANVKVIEGTVYNHEDKSYDYIVYVENSQCKIIYSSTLKVSPFVVFRWNKVPSEVMGRGPALNCMPTMKTLNRLVHDLLKNNAMAINPPAIINSGAFVNPNRVQLVPNSRIVAKSDWMGNRGAVEYLQTGTNFNLGIGMRDEARQQVREAFFLHMNQNVQSPVRSATEVSLLASQQLEQQTSAFTRLKVELVDAVIKRCYHILQRLALVQDLEIGNGAVSVKSTSELSKVQDMKDLESLTNYFQTLIGTFGEAGMGLAASTIDVQQLPRYYAQTMGIPAKLILDEQQAQQQAAGLQEQMMQMQQAQMGGQAQAPMM